MNFPQYDDNAWFNAGVTIGAAGGEQQSVSKYYCAEPGPAQAMQEYLNTTFGSFLKVLLVQAWPLYNQDLQGSNPFKQSSKVPWYVITTPDGLTLLDWTRAGDGALEYARMGEAFFGHLINMWYAPGGTTYQPGGSAWMQQQEGDTLQQILQQLQAPPEA